MFDVKKNVINKNDRQVEELSKLTTATVHEAYGKKGAFSPKIKPITVAVITLAEKLNFCLGNLLITIIIAIKAIKKIIVFTSLIIKNC